MVSVGFLCLDLSLQEAAPGVQCRMKDRSKEHLLVTQQTWAFFKGPLIMIVRPTPVEKHRAGHKLVKSATPVAILVVWNVAGQIDIMVIWHSQRASTTSLCPVQCDGDFGAFMPKFSSFVRPATGSRPCGSPCRIANCERFLYLYNNR